LTNQEEPVPQTRLEGVIAASITPVTPDCQIDVPRLVAHVRQLLAQGCSHVSTFGTTGEGASLATGQKIAALRALKDAGLDMARQVPAIITPVLEDAMHSLVAYRELGCRAVLVLPPFYYGATEEGVAGYYDALIERTSGARDTDLLLYNIPQLSRVKFTKSLVERIVSRHGSRIVGIKDSTGDIENGLMLVETFRHLSIFTGDDRVLPTLVTRGGAGMIGGLPNLFASDLKALYDNPRNREILDKQTRRIVAVDEHGSLVALKAGLAHYGGDEDLARPLPPLQALDAKQRASLIASFEKAGLCAAT
jgi:4-hydroxy-tetrahydrodipicolinate synthase